MKSMFLYGMGVLIFCVSTSDSFEIWLRIYIFRVSDVRGPNFLIVEFLYPMIFSAIYPPDQSEFTPIVLGSIPLSYSLRVFAEVLTA